MELSNLNIIILIFKILCGTTTLFMVGYWVYEFQKNEDVSQVQYISIKEMEEVFHPEMTICIFKPLLIEAFDENVNYDDYLEYLYGDRDHDTKYDSIRFYNVTINIFDYLQYPVSLVQRDTTIDEDSCKAESNCSSISLRNSFSGFVNGKFTRCFSIGISQNFAKHAHAIGLRFKSSLADVLENMQKNGLGGAFLVSNYPNQVSRYVNKYQKIWRTASKRYMNIAVEIAGMEILKRRDKKDDPCITNWKDYDNLLIKRHVSKLECSTPYLNESSKPICSSAVEMIESSYDMDLLKEKFKPCQGMSNVEIDYRDLDVDDTQNSGPELQLRIEYPSEVKMITQARSVDLHALVGYIGGYIGLFLGMSFIVSIVQIISYFVYSHAAFDKYEIIFTLMILSGYAVIQIPEFAFSICKYARRRCLDNNIPKQDKT